MAYSRSCFSLHCAGQAKSSEWKSVHTLVLVGRETAHTIAKPLPGWHQLTGGVLCCKAVTAFRMLHQLYYCTLNTLSTLSALSAVYSLLCLLPTLSTPYCLLYTLSTAYCPLQLPTTRYTPPTALARPNSAAHPTPHLHMPRVPLPLTLVLPQQLRRRLHPAAKASAERLGSARSQPQKYSPPRNQSHMASCSLYKNGRCCGAGSAQTLPPRLWPGQLKPPPTQAVHVWDGRSWVRVWLVHRSCSRESHDSGPALSTAPTAFGRTEAGRAGGC